MSGKHETVSVFKYLQKNLKNLMSMTDISYLYFSWGIFWERGKVFCCFSYGKNSKLHSLFTKTTESYEIFFLYKVTCSIDNNNNIKITNRWEENVIEKFNSNWEETERETERRRFMTISYFSLRADSLRAFWRCRFPLSLTIATSLASDVDVSSDSIWSKLIFFAPLLVDGSESSTTSSSVIGVSTGVVIIEWSLLIIIVSSFSIAAAESKSILLLFFKLFKLICQILYANFERN